MAPLRDLDRRVLETLCNQEGEPYAGLRAQIPFLRHEGLCRSGIGYRAVFAIDRRASPIPNAEIIVLGEVFGLLHEDDEAVAFEVIVANGFIWGLDAIASSPHYWPPDEDQIRVLVRKEGEDRGPPR